jgi:hypothetical protein
MPVKKPVDHLPTAKEAEAKFHGGKWFQHAVRDGKTITLDPKTKIEVKPEWRKAFTETPEQWRVMMSAKTEENPGMTTTEKMAVAGVVALLAFGLWRWMR